MVQRVPVETGIHQIFAVCVIDKTGAVLEEVRLLRASGQCPQNPPR